MTRFQFLRRLLYLILSALIYPVRLFAGLPSATPVSEMTPSWAPPGKHTPAITPTNAFYIEDISGPPQSLKAGAAGWKLQVTGNIRHPLALDTHQLLERPSVQRIITLSCIGNPVGGHAIGTAVWRGVPLRDLLREADPEFFAKTLIMKGEDGYHDSIPLSKGKDALLIYQMNGQPLTREHGHPLRLLVPGLYGIKQVKWLREIEVSDHSHEGYGQKRKWTKAAKVKIMSRIDSHREGEWVPSRKTVIRGIAFSGDRGIQYVQVSLNGEHSWQLARLEKPQSPYSWVFWSLPCTFPKRGRYPIAVRAADQYSGLQTDDHRDAFPAGVSGIHRIHINVL